MQRPLKFIVTGCPRSGTEYLTRVLNDCGIQTSHERMFTPYQASTHVSTGEDTMGEVSWLAVPHLHKYASWPIHRVHLVRHPVRCVNSIIRTEHMNPRSTAWTAYLDAHLRRMLLCYDEVEDPFLKACWFWYAWNGEAEKFCGQRIAVESLSSQDIDALCRQARMDCPPYDRIDHVLSSTPRDINGAPGKSWIGWSDLPEPIKEMADIYGYSDEEAGCERVEAAGQNRTG